MGCVHCCSGSAVTCMQVHAHPCMHRWALWLAHLEALLAEGRRYDPEAWRMQSLVFTLEWAAQTRQPLQLEPRGDAVEVSRRLYEKYVGPSLALEQEVAQVAQAMDIMAA